MTLFEDPKDLRAIRAAVSPRSDRFNAANVAFDEVGHTYYCRTTGLRFMSVSKLKSRASGPFDSDGKIVFNQAVKQGLFTPDGVPDVSAVQRQWAAARDYGAVVHAEIEAALTGEASIVEKLHEQYALGLLSVLPDEATATTAALALESIPSLAKPGVIAYPECVVSYKNEAAGIALAGRADLIIASGDKLVVYDFKTDAKLTRAPYRDGDCYDAPFDFVWRCKTDEYKLQLTLLAWMLRKQKLGVQQLVLLHCRPDGVERVKLDTDWLLRLDEIEESNPAALAAYPPKAPTTSVAVAAPEANTATHALANFTRFSVKTRADLSERLAEALADDGPASAYVRLDFLAKAAGDAMDALKEKAVGEISGGRAKLPDGAGASVSETRNFDYAGDPELTRLEAQQKAAKGAVDARRDMMKAAYEAQHKAGVKPGETVHFVDPETGEAIPPAQLKSVTVKITPKYDKS